MSLIINWIVSAIVIFAISQFLPGVHVDNFTSSLIVALVLGIINAILKPILLILTLPINILTLGLFTFVINAVLILLVSNVVTGFVVDGFIWALIFGFILSVVNSLVHTFLP